MKSPIQPRGFAIDERADLALRAVRVQVDERALVGVGRVHTERILPRLRAFRVRAHPGRADRLAASRAAERDADRQHGDQRPQARHYPERDACHFHACSTMVERSGYRGWKLSSCWASRASATSDGASPGRRPTSRRGTVRPLTRSTAAITSRTEWPAPVPTLAAKLGLPAARWSSARRCAWARSTTWM